MSQSSATQRGSEQADAIRPFPVASVPEAELTDLRKRINATSVGITYLGAARNADA